MKKTIIAIFISSIFLVGWIVGGGASNFDRLVLGEANFGTDPNPTADITGVNDEYISNYSDGQWDFGAANLVSTGTLNVGALTTTTFIKGRDTLNGTVDSVKNPNIAATDYVLFTIKYGATDTVEEFTPALTSGKLTITRVDSCNGALVYDYLIMK
jgi:hypothetical protein